MSVNRIAPFKLDDERPKLSFKADKPPCRGYPYQKFHKYQNRDGSWTTVKGEWVCEEKPNFRPIF